MGYPLALYYPLARCWRLRRATCDEDEAMRASQAKGLLARLRSSDAAAAHAHKYTSFVMAGERVGQVQTSLVGLLLTCTGPYGPCFEQLDGALGLAQGAHPTAEHRIQGSVSSSSTRDLSCAPVPGRSP